jgi:hypothetical protein
VDLLYQNSRMDSSSGGYQPVRTSNGGAPPGVSSSLLTHQPFTPNTVEIFSYDNVTDINAVDRTSGFHPPRAQRVWQFAWPRVFTHEPRYKSL